MGKQIYIFEVEIDDDDRDLESIGRKIAQNASDREVDDVEHVTFIDALSEADWGKLLMYGMPLS